MVVNIEKIKGCLIGAAVGDAVGLPFENISHRRISKFHYDFERPIFFAGKGMFSDDTEHSCMTAQSILSCYDNIERIPSRLAWKLRWWFLGVPPSIGLATLKSIVKLWLGFSYRHSGVGSAGNGPAMRAGIIGISYGHNPEILKTVIAATTKITHTGIKVETGSRAVALASYLAYTADLSPDTFLNKLISFTEDIHDEEFIALMKNMVKSVQCKETTHEFARSINCANGISGYIYHTVPCVLHCALRNIDDFEAGIKEIILCGGDTDTTAAITGAIIGSNVGVKGIPANWTNNILDFPRTMHWIARLADRLAVAMETQKVQKELPLPILPYIIRNIFFTTIVFLHIVKRCLPPY